MVPLHARLDYHSGEIKVKYRYPDSDSPVFIVEWGKGIIGKALEEKQPIIVDDISSPDWQPIYIKDWENMQSEIAIPIVLENIPVRVESEVIEASAKISDRHIKIATENTLGSSGSKLIGILNIENPKKNAFSETDKEVLCLLARYVAMRIEDIESSIKLAKLRQKEKEIADREEDFDCVINIVIKSIIKILGFEIVNVSLVDLQKGIIETKYIDRIGMSF
jgi:putative methionine-R-sulfoxide reductase with GAF domain